MDDATVMHSARAHVRRIRGWYLHAFVYAATVTVIILVRVADLSPVAQSLGGLVAGWGGGVLVHGAWVFVSDRFFGPAWKKRRIREFVERHTTDPRR